MKTNLLKVVMVLAAMVVSGSAFAAVSDVTAISPTSGPSGGGQFVRIYGSGFDTTAANNVVTLNGVAVTVTAATATQLTCTTLATTTTGSGLVVVNTNSSGASTQSGGAVNYKFVSRNNKLVVQISATVANRAQIQWGTGTTVDDASVDHTVAADYITNYAWTVKDNSIGVIAGKQQIDLATNYRSDDFNNGKTINVSNVSSIAGSSCTISAIATGGAPYTLAAAAAPDVISVSGEMNNTAMKNLFTAKTLTNNLTVGSDQPLVLEFDSPTTITNGNQGQTAVVTVTLTATGN